MGLTDKGIKGRILDGDWTMAPQEVIDLFNMYPNNVVVKWTNQEMESVTIKGLGVTFKMRK